MMGQKGQGEALKSPGNDPKGAAVFPRMRSKQDNHQDSKLCRSW